MNERKKGKEKMKRERDEREKKKRSMRKERGKEGTNIKEKKMNRRKIKPGRTTSSHARSFPPEQQ